MNYTHKKIQVDNIKNLKTTEGFEGNSIEDKVRRVSSSNEPIEAISPMVYTERKEGVRPETNIRTDRFEVALKAMESIAMGTRQKREERIKVNQPKTQEQITQKTNSAQVSE